MGLLDSILGLDDLDSVPGIGQSAGPSIFKSQGAALASLFQLLGGELDFTATNKDVKAGKAVKLGKGNFAFIPSLEDVLGQAGKFEDKALSAQVDTANKLFGPSGPAFLKNIAAEAEGSVEADFAPLFNKLLGETLGAAAPKGLLNTDAVLQKLSGPTALTAAQFFQGVKKQAEAQKLGIIGSGGLGGGAAFAPTNIGAPPNLQQQQASLATFMPFVQGPQFFNANTGLEAAGLKAGFLSDLAGFGLGAAFPPSGSSSSDSGSSEG